MRAQKFYKPYRPLLVALDMAYTPGPRLSVNIPQHIRVMIESLQCPKHHKHPMLVIEGDGEEIKINCCCAEFKKQCLYLVSKFMVVRQKHKME